MSDVTSSATPEGEAPAPPPLRATFLVWPGRVHGQTWMLLWVAVAFLIGSFLPWHGPNDVEYVLASPFVTQQATSEHPAQSTNVLTAVQYRIAARNSMRIDAEAQGYGHPGAIIDVREPGMGLSAVIVAIFAIAAVTLSLIGIWNRRVAVMPVMGAWLVALVMLYFSKGSDDPGPGYLGPESVKGFAQMGAVMGAVFGNFGSVWQGNVTPEMMRVFDRFGNGFYVVMLAELFMTAFLVISMVMGAMSGKPDDAAKPASGPAARRSKPAGLAPKADSGGDSLTQKDEDATNA